MFIARCIFIRYIKYNNFELFMLQKGFYMANTVKPSAFALINLNFCNIRIDVYILQYQKECKMFIAKYIA